MEPPRAPKLSREDAETAAILYETCTLAEVGEAAGVKPDLLYCAWRPLQDQAAAQAVQ